MPSFVCTYHTNQLNLGHHQDEAELSTPSPAKLSKTENGARPITNQVNQIPCSLEIHSPNTSPSVVTVRALVHHKNTRDTSGEGNAQIFQCCQFCMEIT